MTSLDDINHSRRPYVNYCLIGLNFIVYAWELSLGTNLFRATEILGFVPAHFAGYLFHAQLTFSQAVLPLFASLFLHGSALHFMPNMCLLFIFGGGVEDVIGHGRYLLFYLAGGVGANLIYVLFSPFSTVPLIGASGAIAGVMAAYLSLFPEYRYSNILIIAWVLLQFLYGILALMNKVAGQAGMAWWAHVGGFVVGLALIRLLAPRGVRLIPFRRRREDQPEE